MYPALGISARAYPSIAATKRPRAYPRIRTQSACAARRGAVGPGVGRGGELTEDARRHAAASRTNTAQSARARGRGEGEVAEQRRGARADAGLHQQRDGLEGAARGRVEAGAEGHGGVVEGREDLLRDPQRALFVHPARALDEARAGAQAAPVAVVVVARAPVLAEVVRGGLEGLLDVAVGEALVLFGEVEPRAQGGEGVEELDRHGHLPGRARGDLAHRRRALALEVLDGVAGHEVVEGLAQRGEGAAGLAEGRVAREGLAGQRGRVGERAHRHGHVVAEAVERDQREVLGAAAHEVVGEGDGEALLHLALEGAGAVARVVRAAHEHVEELGLDVDQHVRALDAAAAEELGEELVHHLPERVAGERVEGHHAVEAVEELGAKEALRRSEIVLPGLGGLGPREARARRRLAHAEVAREDHHALPRVGETSRGVGDPALAEELQEGVEDSRVGLLDLVEEHHAEGLHAQRAGELAVGLSRVTEQAGDAPRVAELAHVEAQHALGAAEEQPREGLGALGLAHARGAHEEEVGEGLVGVAEHLLHRHDELGEGLHRGALPGDLRGEGVADVAARPRRGLIEHEVGQARALPHGLAHVAGVVAPLVTPIAGGAALARSVEHGAQQAHGLAGEGGVGLKARGEGERGGERRGRDPGRRCCRGSLVFEVAQRGEQHREGLALGHRGEVHHAKEPGEGGGLFARPREPLGGALGDDRELAAGEVRLEELRDVGVALARAPGADHRREVVEVEHVARVAELGDHRAGALLPLPDELHPGDEAVAVDAPDVAPRVVPRAPRPEAPHELVHHRGLARAAGAHQHHGDALAPGELLHQRVDRGVAPEGSAQGVVGRGVGEVAPHLAQRGDGESPHAPPLLAGVVGEGLVGVLVGGVGVGVGARGRRALAGLPSPDEGEDRRRVGVDVEELKALAAVGGVVLEVAAVLRAAPLGDAAGEGLGEVFVALEGEAQRRDARWGDHPEGVAGVLLQQRADAARDLPARPGVGVVHRGLDAHHLDARVGRELVAGELLGARLDEALHHLEPQVVLELREARPHGVHAVEGGRPRLHETSRALHHHERNLQLHPGRCAQGRPRAQGPSPASLARARGPGASRLLGPMRSMRAARCHNFATKLPEILPGAFPAGATARSHNGG